MHTDFDFLAGIVRVGADAPEAWRREGLLEFFVDPNNAAWGSSLCRQLYHETLHFWQLLGWGYVANCAAVDWQRLVAFERTGALPRPAMNGLDSMFEAGPHPFSPRELMEAVARFWDVHTRSPAQVIADERIPADAATGPLTVPDPRGGGLDAYTHHAYDLVMQHGPDCREYARPYRWLLDRVSGHSAFAVIMFPLCAHAAMGTQNPVAVFCETIGLAWENDNIRELMRGRAGDIHSDWVTFGPLVTSNVLGAAATFTGLNVIERAGLRDHPVYREYPQKALFRGYFRLYQPTPRSRHPDAIRLAERVHRTALEHPYMLFALPGEPVYRRALGETVPPPVVRFANFDVPARRPVDGKIAAAQAGTEWDDDYGPACADLERRLARFHAAEYADSIGLPPNAFESDAPRARKQSAIR